MKKSLLIVLLAATACATPMTMLKHPKSGEIVTCGGGTAGSIAGGMIGYSIQKSNDKDCVEDYKNKGYKIEHVEL